MDGLADAAGAQLLVDDIPTALMLAREGCGAAVLPCFVAEHGPIGATCAAVHLSQGELHDR